MTERENSFSIPSLANLKVLIVEDEVIILFLIQDLLEELGCTEVWQASSVQGALTILADRTPDLAVLDVNVGGDLVYPVAGQLSKAGVPFLFTTGYGRVGIPEHWIRLLCCRSPMTLQRWRRR
jgi:CheY-like chemotaxis protein